MSLNKINKITGDKTLVAGGTLFADNPIGTILPYGGTEAPRGWFLCQGQEISRTTYKDLFDIIGTAFGAGDDSTTFNLPDLREAVPKGAGLTGHTVEAHLDADGLAVGEFLDDRVQEHTHTETVSTSTGSGSQLLAIRQNGDISPQSITIGARGQSDRYGATTEVKSVGVNYIIKALMIGIPFDLAEYIRNQNVLSEYESIGAPTSSNQYICQYDGFINARNRNGYGGNIYVNNTVVSGISSINNGTKNNIGMVAVKKGDAVYCDIEGGSVLTLIGTFYKLRDYTGR